MATPTAAPTKESATPAMAARMEAIDQSLAGYPAPPSPIEPAERARFRSNLTRVLKEEGLDALLIEPGGTLEYLTGVSFRGSERFMAAAALADGSFVWVTPAFEASRVEGLCTRATGSAELTANLLPWDEHQDAATILAEALGARGMERVAADPDVR